MSPEDYEKAAQAYLHSLPLEHFTKAVNQSTQCSITVSSLGLIRCCRPGFHSFSELLVQYPQGPQGQIRQVVPDVMVVLHPGPIKAYLSYDTPFQPSLPYFVMDCLSRYVKRKDYEDNYLKFERDLKVPYYLLIDPDEPEFTLFRHTGRKYTRVRPNASGRLAIPKLKLEMGLLNGVVRYWYKEELLLLPAEMQRALEEARRQLREAQEDLRLAQEQTRKVREQVRQALARKAEAERKRQLREYLLDLLRRHGLKPEE